MEADWTSRCKLAVDAYKVENGYALLTHSFVSEQIRKCMGKSTGHIVNTTAVECPFLMAVYALENPLQMQLDEKDTPSASIRTTGHWARREVALLHDLSSDSLVVDIGANVGWHTLVALSLGHRYYHVCVLLLSRSLVLSFSHLSFVSLFRLSLLSPPPSLRPSLLSLTPMLWNMFLFRVVI
jgi:hypothetical protein